MRCGNARLEHACHARTRLTSSHVLRSPLVGFSSGAGPEGAVTLEGGGTSRTGPAGAVADVKRAVVESSQSDELP